MLVDSPMGLSNSKRVLSVRDDSLDDFEASSASSDEEASEVTRNKLKTQHQAQVRLDKGRFKPETQTQSEAINQMERLEKRVQIHALCNITLVIMSAVLAAMVVFLVWNRTTMREGCECLNNGTDYLCNFDTAPSVVITT